MTATPTSAAAYRAALATGLIPKSRLRIYEYLYAHGPATAREIFRALGSSDGCVTPRLGELEAMGVVRRNGTKVAGPTGTPAILWEWVPTLPVPYVRKVTNAQKLELVLGLVAEAEDLAQLRRDVLALLESWEK